MLLIWGFNHLDICMCVVFLNLHLLLMSFHLFGVSDLFVLHSWSLGSELLLLLLMDVFRGSARSSDRALPRLIVFWILNDSRGLLLLSSD